MVEIYVDACAPFLELKFPDKKRARVFNERGVERRKI